MNWTPLNEFPDPRTRILSTSSFLFILIVGMLLFSFFLTACSDDSPDNNTSTIPISPSSGVTDEPIEAATETLEPSPTIPPPTPTPQLAALVNGQPILLETFDKELQRYEKAMAELGLTPGADGQDYRLLVLDALIEQELIRQAAEVAGVSITADMVDSKIADLRQAASESGSFENWLAANQWSEDEFRAALTTEMLAEAMIAKITADVPDTAEQVRASYIQLDDGTLAESLLAQIQEGADFADLAIRYSRDSVTGPAGGDLGYFARGTLLVPEVEEAAYQLNVDDVSNVITVTDGESGKATYYIIKVTDIDSNRPLNADLHNQLLQERFNLWLEEQRANATIQYLLDEG
jgi:parvulin-like peptidyl-prolyl isomerase